MADRITPDEYSGGDTQSARGTRNDRESGESLRSAGAAVKHDVQETAHHALDRAQDRAAEEARHGKRALSHKVNAVAHALRRVGDSLEDDGEGELARYGRSTAEQVERFGGYLDRNDVRGLLSDVEGMARRNPGAFVATTFAAGLLLGRFLRSSPDDRRETNPDWNGVRDRDFDGVTGEPVTDLPERGEGAWGTQATHSRTERDDGMTDSGVSSRPLTDRQTDLSSGPRGE